MSNPKIDLFVEQLSKARQDTLKAASAVPDSARLLQLKPGKATPLWLVGHLANTVNTVVLRWMLDVPGVLSREQAMLFAPDFAGGAPVSADANQYPAWSEVVALYDKAMSSVLEQLPKNLSDNDLPAPLKRAPEPMRTFFSSNGVTLMQMVSHDAYHRGQIGLLAKLG
jgi:uncharacterized damage-inducible protein DinB